MAEESDKVDGAKTDEREGASAADPAAVPAADPAAVPAAGPTAEPPAKPPAGPPADLAGVHVSEKEGETVKWTPVSLEYLENLDLQLGAKAYRNFCQKR